MRLTEEEMDPIVERIVDFTSSRIVDAASVVPVHTCVHQLTKTPTPGTSPTIVVPAFASHCEIVVGDDQMLFRLIFVHPSEGDVSDLSMGYHNIRFHVMDIYKPLSNAKPVHYNIYEFKALGKVMIREFGNYYRVFWNCPAFAKCFMRVITWNVAAKFDDWTSADTSRLFLCAFLIGAPFASTNKISRNNRADNFVKQIESVPARLSVAGRSDREPKAMYEQLKQDPLWGA